MNGKKISAVLMLAALVLAGAQAEAAVDIGDYTATPAFVSRSVRPNVMFLFSNDHTNFYVGYRGLSDYNNGLTYFGYFDPNKCYKYDSAFKYFYTDDAWNAFDHYTIDSTGREADGSNTVAQKDLWSGNFLNWVTMCHGDFVRKTLTGGRVASTDGSTYWVLERGTIPNDGHKWTKVYAPATMTNPDVGALIPYAPYVAATYTPVYPTESNRTLYYTFDTWSDVKIPDVATSDSADNYGDAKNGTARDTTTKFYGTASANFDGINDFVEVDDHDEVSNFAGNLTVEFWMRRDTNDNDELIIGNGGTGSNSGFKVVSRNGGRIRFNLWRGGTDSDFGVLDSVSVPSNGAWHYIVCTYDKNVDTDGDATTPVVGVMRIYIDGCLNAESATEYNGDVGNSGDKLTLGYAIQPPYNLRYFDGRLDEVSLWKETFTSTMVRSRYENTWGTRTINCLAAFGGGTYNFENVSTTMRVYKATVDQTFPVKVKTTTEPRGLIQDFSGSIRFGLMSYSYEQTEKGGVLRANISSPSESATEYNRLLSFINTFEQKGWDPTAEMFWEATRYFRNSSRTGGTVYSPNTDFTDGDTADGSTNQFPIPSWTDPMLSECQKNFIIVVNDEYPSRDLDMMPGGYNGLSAESVSGLAAATVGTYTAPTGGLSSEWWTNRVGEFEGINGTQRRVGCYGGNTTGTCDPLKTVTLLGRAYGICPNEPTSNSSGSFNIAGASYWARTTHLRPDLVSNAMVATDPSKKITIETFAVAFRASPSGYIVPEPPMNQLWLAAKYGGFQDKNGNNVPDLSSEWDQDGDGVPDNFAYAEEGEQFSAALRKALLTILSRSASGTAASILSASRSGQGALYQAMFYPSRTDHYGNFAEWTGQLSSFWVDQFGSLREETPADPITAPTSITQPFTGTTITAWNDLKQLNLYHDKVIKLFFDTSLGRTRAKLYEVSTLGRIVSGKATKTATDVLWDSGASFSQAGVAPGMKVENLTTAAIATIDTPTSQATVTATTVKATGMTWTVGDEYIISQVGPDPAVRELEELNPIWDGGRWLAEHGAKDRRIFAWVDVDADGAVDGSNALLGTLTTTDEVKELKGTGSQAVTIGTGPRATTLTETNYVLETDTLAATLMPYLRATSNLQSAQIINWVRGVDQPGVPLRRRTFLTPNDTTTGYLRTLKLGDIVQSTPTIVGTPTEDYDLIYGDKSYTAFYKAYGDRRNVVYVGANDGMLHAFNVGFYDRDHGAFYDHTGYTIGQELWAFVPHQLLPHLEFLTQVQYVHVYFMDQKPRIFDARIFTADSTHVNGWGTLLLAGMRMGGKTMQVDLNGDGDTTDTGETFRSAYCLLDVTEPLQPKLLGAFTDSNLGLTTSFPAILRIQDKWFMAVGSGPNGTDAYLGKSAQRGWFYVVEITSSGFTLTKKILLPDTETTTFVGDPSAVDLNMATASSTTYTGGINWSAEALYFGSVYQSSTYNSSNPVTDSNRQWLGRMHHLRLTSDTSLSVPDPTGAGWSSPVPKLAVSSATIPVGPISAAANVTKDTNGRYWVYFGTGRYFASADIDDTCTQTFFGLKEPIYTSGADLGKPDFGSVTIEADTDLTSGTSKSLFDATNAKVYEGGYVDVNGDGSMEYTAPMGFSTFAQAVDQKKNGWVLRTSAGERMLGMPNIIGGISLFTGYIPPAGTQCQYEGTSNLYAPYFKTGTAFRRSVIGLGNDVYSGSQLVQRKTSLGAGVATSPTIHVGEKSKAFIQSSTGAIIDTETATAFPIKSGARSWRTE